MPCLKNIGILAHVDAGKTTTTEHMLYETGNIRAPGRVDEGTAHTDWMDVERARGISVRSAVARLPWKDSIVNLIDTPGHVDFSAEVQRALRVLDGAVLVISAPDGVQAHTSTIWRALRALRTPTLIYVNKVDRVGVDCAVLLDDLRSHLDQGAIPVQAPDACGPDFSMVRSALGDAPPPGVREALHALLAERDERLLEQYVSDSPPSPAQLRQAMSRQVQNGDVFPVLFGASLRGIGIRELLDAIADWLPAAPAATGAPLAGTVFKIERDRALGPAAYVRLFQGELRNRDTVFNTTRQCEEKIHQIRQVSAHAAIDTGVLGAGDVAAVYGLSEARVGDVLGVPGPIPDVQPLAVPLLAVQVSAGRPQDEIRLAEALAQLDAEDPSLEFQWVPSERELHIKVMGAIQLEILQQMVRERFGIDMVFSPPSVIYKETPRHPADGRVAYTMPKPCWAILRFHIEPGPQGSGLRYASTARADRLLPGYQNEVARRVPEALQQGLSGFEVTDLAVTLVEGEHHIWHTHPLDFAVATPMGIMDALQNAGTRLLEPILAFELSIPQEQGGKMLSELALMRAEYGNPQSSGDRMLVEGVIPLATSHDFPVRLGMLTSGRGLFSTRFLEYRPAPEGVVATRKRRGVDPRDTARYILAARSALVEP